MKTESVITPGTRGRKPSKYLQAMRALPLGEKLRVPNKPPMIASLRVCMNRGGFGVAEVKRGERFVTLRKVELREKKLNADVSTIHKEFLKANCTRAEAEALAKFAGRPLYWGEELIGKEYLVEVKG